MLQNATPLRKSAAWPPNISHWTCLLSCACHAKSIFADPLRMSPARHRFWKCHKTLTFCSLLAGWGIPCTRHTNRLQRPKVAWTCGVLCILTSTCASRHNGVHFFDIWTSKSGPTMVCFVHFDFEMCFAPQRRALLRHRGFQKCSEREVFLAFSLANVLRATTACTFSTSQLRFFVHFDFDMCFAPQRRALFHHLNFQKWPSCCVYFVYFDLETCFAPQRGATFHLSSDHMAPHPPL